MPREGIATIEAFFHELYPRGQCRLVDNGDQGDQYVEFRVDFENGPAGESIAQDGDRADAETDMEKLHNEFTNSSSR